MLQQELRLCVQQGTLRGKRQAVDSAYIKANASMDNLKEKEIIDDVEQYVHELNENSEYKVKASVKKSVERHHEWKKKHTKGYRVM